jgi:endo-1,4-beta-D-glucanase Y
VQKIRQRKQQKLTKDARAKSSEQANGSLLVAIAEMEKFLNDATEKDMDTFSAQDALDTQRAYYKVRLSLNVLSLFGRAFQSNVYMVSHDFDAKTWKLT